MSAGQCPPQTFARPSDGARSEQHRLLSESEIRGPTHVMSEVLQRALNPRIAPRRVLGRHAHGEGPDLRVHTRAPRAATCVCPLADDHIAMPPENGVRRGDCGHIPEGAAFDPVPDRSETSPFISLSRRRQPHRCALHPVFFAQECDHVVLLLVHPTAQQRDERRQPPRENLTQRRSISFGTARGRPLEGFARLRAGHYAVNNRQCAKICKPPHQTVPATVP
jgi:hypothetical protein